jgi:hypothetical protein
MGEWRYFYKVYGDANVNDRPRALGRTDPSGHKYNAQMLGRDSKWIRSEFLERYHLLGTNEDDYVEISDDRALDIIEEWVASGRLPRWPDEPKRPAT